MSTRHFAHTTQMTALTATMLALIGTAWAEGPKPMTPAEQALEEYVESGGADLQGAAAAAIVGWSRLQRACVRACCIVYPHTCIWRGRIILASIHRLPRACPSIMSSHAGAERTDALRGGTNARCGIEPAGCQRAIPP